MQAPGGGGDPGGGGGGLAPGGRGGRLRQGRHLGEARGGAGEVEGHDGADQPGGVGVEDAGGQVGQGGGLQVGVHVLDNRVPPVGLVRGDRVEVIGCGGGEEGVEAPHVEQRLLPGALLRVELGDAADDEPATDLVGLLL